MKYLPALALLLIVAASASAQIKASAPSRYDFTAATMDGARIDTSQLRGKILVFNLWFINCPNCLEEMKQLNKLVADYSGNKDVVFLAPAASRKGDLEKFLKKN